MPTKPLRPCRHAGCNKLTRNGYCEIHEKLYRKTTQSKDNRESSAKRGYGRKWRNESKLYLAENPWCKSCMVAGRRVPATEVDHIIPHKGDKKLFWDRKNWQGLCSSCHSKKTSREDGGFGRLPRGQKSF